MKYSILMPYYDRSLQLGNTLSSYRKFYGHRDDWELIIIEDVKNLRAGSLHKDLEKCIAANADLPIRLALASSAAPNPSPRFNQAARKAVGEIFILTSPECYHFTDMLSAFDLEFAFERPYVVVACASATSFELSNGGAKYNHHMWYHHKEKRNTGFHFCTAISRQDYEAIGGFDEDYSDGIAYDDNDFRDRVFHADIPVQYRDDLLVIHQPHQRHHLTQPNYRVLLCRNERLYSKKRMERMAKC